MEGVPIHTLSACSGLATAAATWQRTATEMSGSVTEARYAIWEVTFGSNEECMTPRVTSTCKKKAVSYFQGSEGPYYRCGKCTRSFLSERPDFVLVPNPLR